MSDVIQIYTVSRDGAVFTWKEKGSEDDDSDAEPPHRLNILRPQLRR